MLPTRLRTGWTNILLNVIKSLGRVQPPLISANLILSAKTERAYYTPCFVCFLCYHLCCVSCWMRVDRKIMSEEARRLWELLQPIIKYYYVVCFKRGHTIFFERHSCTVPKLIFCLLWVHDGLGTLASYTVCSTLIRISLVFETLWVFSLILWTVSKIAGPGHDSIQNSGHGYGSVQNSGYDCGSIQNSGIWYDKCSK
jgi:hypothetical protein